jgi:hypothetical protein
MYWNTLLPILALPIAFGKLVARDTCAPPRDGLPRLAFSYTSKRPPLLIAKTDHEAPNAKEIK